MAIHWKIPFKTMRAGHVLTVNVHDASYSGGAVELKGSDRPFETEEDTGDDPFQNVRKQSGYLRIADDGFAADGYTPFDWRDFIPTTDTDRPVTLTDASNNVLWQGFMQAQNFGAALFGNPQVREFPLQCALSVTEGVDANYSQKGVHNFAYLLKTVLDSIPATCRPDRVYVQGSLSWLRKCVDWQNFVETDADNEATARHDMLECLEEMCKFWGWTARTYGRGIYLLCPDDGTETGIVSLTDTMLATLAGGGNVMEVIGHYDTLAITGFFASADNRDYQVRGTSKATFNADANTAGDNVMDVFDQKLTEAMEEAGWTYGLSYNGDYIAKTGDVLTEQRVGFTVSCDSGYASLNRVKKWLGAEQGYGDATNVIMVKRTADLPYAVVTMETAYMHSFGSGFFRFFGETLKGTEAYVETDTGSFAGNFDMIVRFGIGTSRQTARWWDGREWQSQPATFRLTLGNRKQEMFSRYRTGSGWDLVIEDTSAINTPTAMYGYVFFDILGSDNMPETNGERDFNIREFRMEFRKDNTVVRHQYQNSGWYDVVEKDTRRDPYKATNGNAIREERNVDCIFASENGQKAGYGIVLNADGSYMAKITYGSNASEAEHPEQHYVNRIANYWATSKREVEASLLAHNGLAVMAADGISPMKKVSIDGTTTYPISIGREWRDDVIKVKLIEI